MQKAKKYDFKDSNVALFGSPLERQVKEAAAGEETAWHGSGESEGIQIWRIVKFQVVAWPKDQYGEFYMGDSYIVLNTYKADDEEELQHDLHFWIGKYSTQDEYGTAAYKTVELDTYHKDKPVQHREVQGYESDLFQSYFSTVEYLEGGAETGFRHVEPEEYRPRLLHISGNKKRVSVKEVPLSKKAVKSGDVYILDLGRHLVLWIGAKANLHEKSKAMQFQMALKNKRSHESMSSSVCDEGEDGEDEFWEKITGDEDVEEDEPLGTGEKELFRLSDADGVMEFLKVAEGDDVKKSLLKSEDVFILDMKKETYVWVGQDASRSEKQQAMAHASNYLNETDRYMAPIMRILEGSEKSRSYQIFEACF